VRSLYTDLVEHFPTIIALLGLLATVCVFLFWHMFRRMEGKLDKVADSMSNVVTRTECEHRHADLTSFIQAVLGITNCKTCRDFKEKDE